MIFISRSYRRSRIVLPRIEVIKALVRDRDGRLLSQRRNRTLRLTEQLLLSRRRRLAERSSLAGRGNVRWHLSEGRLRELQARLTVAGQRLQERLGSIDGSYLPIDLDVGDRAARGTLRRRQLIPLAGYLTDYLAAETDGPGAHALALWSLSRRDRCALNRRHCRALRDFHRGRAFYAFRFHGWTRQTLYRRCRSFLWKYMFKASLVDRCNYFWFATDQRKSKINYSYV